MNIIRILILEDDLETLSILLDRLHKLEEKLTVEKEPTSIAVTVLSEYTQVEEYINKAKNITFDSILLDRDCKAGGSFHVLDINKYGIDKIIGISSTPPYNEQLKQRGVRNIVQKDYANLPRFADKVISVIEEVLVVNKS